MKITDAAACALLAFVVGGCIGFLIRMHTAGDRATRAIADRYLAEREYLDAERRALLLEIDRHTTTVKKQLRATARLGKEKKKHGTQTN